MFFHPESNTLTTKLDVVLKHLLAELKKYREYILCSITVLYGTSIENYQSTYGNNL